MIKKIVEVFVELDSSGLIIVHVDNPASMISAIWLIDGVDRVRHMKEYKSRIMVFPDPRFDPAELRREIDKTLLVYAGPKKWNAA